VRSQGDYFELLGRGPLRSFIDDGSGGIDSQKVDAIRITGELGEDECDIVARFAIREFDDRAVAGKLKRLSDVR